jgi:diguanylate cyclase (GGDEF)-like protein
MQISDVEIQQRKELLDFTDTDAAQLVLYAERVEQNVDALVKKFYERITSVEENALLIGDADTLQRLHGAMRQYVLGLFEGHYGMAYVNDRLKIGMVHKRMGVAPKWFLAAVKTLRDVLGRYLAGTITERQDLANVLRALDKLLYFDTTLIVDTYIRSLLNEVEVAKDRALVYARDLEQRVAERTRQIEELSQRDVLTGLFNRRALRDILHRELQQARRHRKAVSIAYFDIDDFKAINDTKGHLAGDDALRRVGQMLLRHAREIDFPCRWGGDEFCLVMPDCTSPDAERVIGRLTDEFSTLGLGLTFSTGIVQSGPVTFLDEDECIRLADEKMYRSKTQPGFFVTV